jgi:hypothetical protein
VTELGVEPSQASRSSAETPAQALAAVVENAGELVRAELRLAATEARAWLVRLGLGLALLWLALLFFQVFALALALSPILLKDQPWTSVGAMLLLALLPALGASAFAARELRRLKELPHGSHDHLRRS